MSCFLQIASPLNSRLHQCGMIVPYVAPGGPPAGMLVPYVAPDAPPPACRTCHTVGTPCTEDTAIFRCKNAGCTGMIHLHCSKERRWQPGICSRACQRAVNQARQRRREEREVIHKCARWWHDRRQRLCSKFVQGVRILRARAVAQRRAKEAADAAAANDVLQATGDTTTMAGTTPCRHPACHHRMCHSVEMLHYSLG